MHDLILACCFVGMLMAPAVVAALSGKKSTEPSEASAQIMEMQVMAAPVLAQQMRTQRVTPINYSNVPTLPLHGTRSLAGR